jgi:protocatechuate 3,4-dioxygenase beta subunit
MLDHSPMDWRTKTGSYVCVVYNRRFAARFIEAFSLSLILVLSAYAQVSPELPQVSVELSIRLPDGQPLVDTVAVVKILGSSPFRPRIPDLNVTTDDRGVAKFQISAGAYSILVMVHKVGQGGVGMTEFVPGKVARPPMPPLAGYGSIDVIVSSRCGNDVIVYAGSEEYPLPPGSPNHLHIDDLPAGKLSVTAAINSGPQSWLYDPCSDHALVNVVAEQNIKVVLQPPPSDLTVPKRPGSKPQNILRMPPELPAHTGPVIWVGGTVRDETGNPIPNATVYAVATYYGGIRMNGLTVTTKTEANGHYEIKGEGGLASLSITLVASAPGHPPAWAWPELAHNSLVSAVQDLVLPSSGGQANITVVSAGKPLNGAAVTLYLENANLQDVWARGGPNEEVQNVAYPVATTDDQGIARFENLLPGRYRVLATDAGTDAIRGLAYGFGGPDGRAPSAAAVGIPVQVGQTTNFRLKIFSQSNNASFRVLQDNKPYAGMGADQFGPVDRIELSSSATLDSSGLGHVSLGHVGFWRLDFMFRDSPITFFPLRPPYFQASGTLALSPNLPDHPATLRARHVEPGSARIVVQDSTGHPIHATVQIMCSSSLAVSGTTDDQGVVLFKGLYTGDQVGTLSDQYVALIRSPNFANDPVSDFEEGANPLPAPQLLLTQQVFLDLKRWNERLSLSVGKETTVVVRPDRLRYVYGVLHSSKIKPRYGIRLDEWQDRKVFTYGAKLRVLSDGHYVAGPFLSGAAKILIWDSSSPRLVSVPIEIDATPDEPLRFDFDADKYIVPETPAEKESDAHAGEQLTTGTESYLGMGGITTHTTGANRLTGKVFLSDGKTPALGANVLYYEAGSMQPKLFAITDALGSLQPRGLWQGAESTDQGRNIQFKFPALVAFLPGVCGATVLSSPVHPDEPVHLVLPPPLSVTGEVTVGGLSPTKRPGTIHVLAAYQDQRTLSPALSVTTTADADGRFTLTGLTPGTYLVQAALDEIWLSSVVTLHVSDGPMQAIHLVVPSPGTAVRLELREPSGKPLIGHSVTVERSGPLAYLWPHELISDGSGSIEIPTMESGQQTIRVSGRSKPVEFRVSALPALPVVIRLRIKL